MNRMEPRLRVNVHEDDRLIFGDAEMRLLEAIERQGSLSLGAASLGLAYRSAWGKLRAMEVSLGARLIETTVGGSGGGSSRLTETARGLLRRYMSFRESVGSYALAEFARCFGEGADCSKLILSPVPVSDVSAGGKPGEIEEARAAMGLQACSATGEEP